MTTINIISGVFLMQKVLKVFLKGITALSLVMAVVAASSATIWMSYQPECPQELVK
jgi:cyclic lactone autoinducer peptide